MSECIIQRHQSLTELYSSLLIRKREIEREEDKGAAKCRLCTNQKSHHVQGSRCPNGTPREFLNDRCEERKKVATAIDLIEQLLEID